MWGYCGILSLGHALFFALGGYAMGMYLMRAIGHDGNVRQRPARLHGVPRLASSCLGTGEGTQHLGYALLLVVLVPAVLAWVFELLHAFRSRVKGVYLSIITQAMTFAAMLLFYRNETGFGGNNGFMDFKRIGGLSRSRIRARAPRCCLITFAVLDSRVHRRARDRHVEARARRHRRARWRDASHVPRL